MTSQTKILVPVDFSPSTPRAIAEALELAAHYGAEVTFLAVNEPILSPSSELGPPLNPPADSCAYLEKSLAQLIEEYRKPDGPSLQAKCLTGDPASSIVEFAEDGGYRFIVMGTHGRRGLARLILGSVAEVVVRKAPCTVITVRPPPEGETGKSASSDKS